MNELEKITVKYHRHLEEDDVEGMVYFTMEDVHNCMKEYHKSKSDCISNVSILSFIEWYNEKYVNVCDDPIERGHIVEFLSEC